MGLGTLSLVHQGRDVHFRMGVGQVGGNRMVHLCGYVGPLILVIKCRGEGWNKPKGK